MPGFSPRSPSIQVIAGGVPVSGVTELRICSDAYMGADRFHVAALLDDGGYDVWAGPAIEVSILIAAGGAMQTMITGLVDRVDVDVGSRLVRADGRDLTARFMEARTQETFENSTASEVVTVLASRRGLTAQVTPTQRLIGRDYDGAYARTTLDQYAGVTTEWDLLARLADAEGFDVWMDGETLNFAAPAPPTAQISVTPQDCVDLRLERLLALSDGLEVVVKSWDSRAQQAIVQTAGGASGSGQPRRYVVVRPNMSAAVAASLANRLWSQMTQNARIVTLELPGDATTRPRQSLLLSGTGTDFDGPYVITSVERHLSFRHGFTQTLQARTPPWTISSTI